MTFVNPLLLAGAALIVIPVVLHLVMRRRPVRMEFPALRLVRQRHDATTRRLRWQHLLLMAARAAIIALLAFALARPSIQFAGSWGSQEAPVAAIMVFDTAARMEYRTENQTRLEKAREMALWLLTQLPKESQIGVLDTQPGPGAFQVDRSAAQTRIERLAIVPPSQPVAESVAEAYRLTAESDLTRKEIYVFTDLAQDAWPREAIESFLPSAEGQPEVQLFLIDVGAKRVENFGLGALELGAQVLSESAQATVRTELVRQGPAGRRTVELLLADGKGGWDKRGQQEIEVDRDGSAELAFRFGGLPDGIVDGMVRLAARDALEADNLRYFTLRTRPPWPILLVAPKTAHTYADYLKEMLAPTAWRRTGQSPFECTTITPGELARREVDALKTYAAICLIDPTPLSKKVWQTLRGYVDDGGGLGIFLGRNARPIDSFNEKEAQKLLPGPLVRQARAGDVPLHPAPVVLEHPVLAPFRAISETPWSALELFRYWELGSTAAGVRSIVPLSDGRPLLLERTVGDGRVLTMTSPVSDRPDRRPWNLMPVTDPWPFLILMNQSARYLVGAAEGRFNYDAGQTAVLRVDRDERPRSYVLTTPEGSRVPISADPREADLLISSTDQPGTYRVEGGGKANRVELGFSVNLAPRQTDLQKLNAEQLAERLEPLDFRTARTREEIERDVHLGRVGRELFPFAVLLVALLLSAEQFLANRFYRA